MHTAKKHSHSLSLSLCHCHYLSLKYLNKSGYVRRILLVEFYEYFENFPGELSYSNEVGGMIPHACAWPGVHAPLREIFRVYSFMCA